MHSSQSSLSSLSTEQLDISRQLSTNNELKYRHPISQHYNTSLNTDNVNNFDQNSDSDSSLLAYDANVLKFSSNNNSIRQTECLGNYSHHNDPSSCNRFMEHVYILEEDDDTEDSDYINSDIQMKKYTHDYNLHRLIEVFTSHRIVFTVIVCVIPFLICAYTMSSSFTSLFSIPEQSLSYEHKIRELTNQLSQEFQGQHKRLWMQLRSVLESPFQHQFTNHQRYTTNERIPPVVFLLVNRIQTIVNNESKYTTLIDNTNVSFHYFILRLGQLLNSLYLSNSKNACSIIESSQLNSLTKQKINQMKLAFDRQLDELYNSGARCFHFTSIDLLPANVVLLFHGYTDVENSVYPNSILLISLSKEFEVTESFNCTMKSDYILPGCKTPGQFEHQVNQFLRSLWNKHLGNEEVDALISRLTTNIIVFHTMNYVI
uniref:SJCHGC06274 protein n=1 Tax=Schistosoma japonicum TaxID=6182 RepID=Q5DBK3_SCHJA|nr:SJCHGC06274 protein [Schistosoma japonicum]